MYILSSSLELGYVSFDSYANETALEMNLTKCVSTDPMKTF